MSILSPPYSLYFCKLLYVHCTCVQAAARVSKQDRQEAGEEPAVSWSSYVQSFVIGSICTWYTALCCLVLTHSSAYFMTATCKFVQHTVFVICNHADCCRQESTMPNHLAALYFM